MGFIALLFLVITAGLLVADLKQPKRFLYVLAAAAMAVVARPRGLWLTGFGGHPDALAASRGSSTRDGFADILLWPGASLARSPAVYTAFLFAQAKGRDFWQNPLLSVHLLAHALLAGSAVWVIVDFVADLASHDAARLC